MWLKCLSETPLTFFLFQILFHTYPLIYCAVLPSIKVNKNNWFLMRTGKQTKALVVEERRRVDGRATRDVDPHQAPHATTPALWMPALQIRKIEGAPLSYSVMQVPLQVAARSRCWGLMTILIWKVSLSFFDHSFYSPEKPLTITLNDNIICSVTRIEKRHFNLTVQQLGLFQEHRNQVWIDVRRKGLSSIRMQFKGRDFSQTECLFINFPLFTGKNTRVVGL